ncbi:oxidoreductase [Penicillium cataractarum]|uniref:Oxidoreductase n=1 Tax=Penicillium cataractarum TaxID=2100454 RepID=A0A9X0B6X3_9EURO|nr:oxidoreductase [Penicillium cataractarum]KAJ5390351.1 oxidoreductase [Penicillium cataractarum]
MDSQTKYALITGCSDGGIGSALAQAFHSKGIHVFATARDISKLQGLQDLSNIKFLQLDVTSPESIAAAYKIVERETNGKLHYLVNNSGAGFVMPLLDSDAEMGQKMFDVNVWGVVRVTQAFASLVVNAKGTVVNNVSTASCLGLPYQGMYCGSKAAIRLMSETLALEMKPLGVKVIIVITGNIRTRWFTNSPRFELPEGSYYASIIDQIGVFARGEQGHPEMEPKVYAEKVVGDVLGGAEGTIWRGAQSSTIRIAMSIIPTWLLNKLAFKGTGLDTLEI